MVVRSRAVYEPKEGRMQLGRRREHYNKDGESELALYRIIHP
jgi:hypothetical protein